MNWFSKKETPQMQVLREHSDVLETARQKRRAAMAKFRSHLEAVTQIDKTIEAMGEDMAGGKEQEGE